MHIEKVTNFKTLLLIKSQWDSLNVADKNICYLCYDWFYSSCKILDQDKELYVLLVKENNKILAIAPFLKKKIYSIPYTIITFINNAYTPYQDFIIPNRKIECLRAIANFLKKEAKFFTYLELNEIRKDLGNMQLFLKILKQEGFFVFETPKEGCYYLKTTISFEKVLKNLKSHTRKEFKRKMNRLTRLGTVDLKTITNPDEIKQHLDKFFNFYKRTWKGAEPHPEFYYHLTDVLYSKYKVILFVLTLNGEPIAYLFSILNDNTLLGIKTTYNPSYYAFSPGIVLFYKTIETACNDSNIKVFELGRGGERFKKEWTSLAYEHVILEIAPKNSANRLYWLSKYQLMPMIRKNDFMYNLYRRAKKLLFTQKSVINKTVSSHTREQKFLLTLDLEKWSYAQPTSREETEIRLATKNDIYQLAVAMEARSIKEVEQKLNHGSFIICTVKNKIISYFYLPKMLNKINDNKNIIYLCEYGIDSEYAHQYPIEKNFFSMVKFLKAYGAKKLIIQTKEKLPNLDLTLQKLDTNVD